MNQEGVLACCAVCNQKTHRRCARCLNIYYCNTEHQKLDWKRHKSECAPKSVKQGTKSENSVEISNVPQGILKKETEVVSETQQKVSKEGSVGEIRLSKKSKIKNVKKISVEGSVNVSKQKPVVPSDINRLNEDNGTRNTKQNDNSVISSVVYSDENVFNDSAITYEGSSEKEILSESVQQLSTVDFTTPSTSNLLRTVNKTDLKMPMLPEQTNRVKEYPEASLKGSVAPFNHMPNSYYMDPSDPFYEICQRVIRDMTHYGVCVLNNFLGKERGLSVLNEVLEMYRSGIFTVCNRFLLIYFTS